MNKLSLYAPKDLFIDPAKIFVDFIKSDLNLNNASEKGSEYFYVSAKPELFVENAKLFYNVKKQPDLINI